MKIETQPRDDHQLKMVVEIEPELYEKHKHIAARKISHDQKIPGFRPGKAPYDIVRRFAGEEVIEQKAIDNLLDEVYPKALEEANIQPYAAGSLEEIVSKDPLKISFIVPLEPVVDLAGYQEIRHEYNLPAVEETSVDEFLERLRSSYAVMTPVDRPAQVGDVVFLTINGHTLPEDEGGESKNLADNRSTQVTVPAADTPESPGDWPFPGFAAHMLGVSASENKTILHKFSEESPFEDLKGKQASFDVQIESVKENKLPDLDADFAQQVGQMETIDELRTAVRKMLVQNGSEEYDAGYFNEVLDKIQAQAMISYPPQAVDNEVHSVLHNIESDLARQKLDLPAYLKLRKMEESEFIEKEVKPAAIKRLERGLLVNEISVKEGLKLDESLFEIHYSRTLNELQSQVDLEKMQKKASQRLANAVTMEAVTRTMNRQVLNRLKKIAGGIEEPQPVAPESTPAAAGEIQPELVAETDTAPAVPVQTEPDETVS